MPFLCFLNSVMNDWKSLEFSWRWRLCSFLSTCSYASLNAFFGLYHIFSGTFMKPTFKFMLCHMAGHLCTLCSYFVVGALILLCTSFIRLELRGEYLLIEYWNLQWVLVPCMDNFLLYCSEVAHLPHTFFSSPAFHFHFIWCQFLAKRIVA